MCRCIFGCKFDSTITCLNDARNEIDTLIIVV